MLSGIRSVLRSKKGRHLSLQQTESISPLYVHWSVTLARGLQKYENRGFRGPFQEKRNGVKDREI